MAKQQLQMQHFRGHGGGGAPRRCLAERHSRRRRLGPRPAGTAGPWWWLLWALVAGFAGVVVANEKHKNGDEPSTVLVCPTTASRALFPLPCKGDTECKIFGEQCCNVDGKFHCMKGVPKPIPEPNHFPILGIIPQGCPKYPVPERLPIKNCTADIECWPRICCPDGSQNYCRTPMPKWQGLENFSEFLAYLQCTAPPPPFLDLFHKPCKNILDCFPNLCCQEKDKKVCRPPKKSMLALLAMVAQGIVSG